MTEVGKLWGGNKNKNIGILLIGILLGLVIGWLLCVVWNRAKVNSDNSTEEFEKGVVEHNLVASEILWEEYPAWREVSFVVTGDVTVCVPVGKGAELSDMVNEESMTEIRRESYEVSNAISKQSLDKVTYRIENGQIKSTGLEKQKDSEIVDATLGYRLCMTIDEEEYALGYIPPMSEVFEAWTSEQAKCANMNLEAYLDVYTLSGTYENTYPLTQKESAKQLTLEKIEGSVLDCRLNNNKQASWSYSGDLPSLELWYRGVWIEHPTPYDSNLTLLSCESGTSEEIKIPEEIMENYSDCILGLYRLVIYGGDGSYVASESFKIE